MNGTDLTLDQLKTIADLEFQSTEMSDSQVTIRQWLGELLSRVWIEKDEFSGKRAFGNSDWEYEIYNVLIQEGVVAGMVGVFGDIEISFTERDKADKIILQLIIELMA